MVYPIRVRSQMAMRVVNFDGRNSMKLSRAASTPVRPRQRGGPLAFSAWTIWSPSTFFARLTEFGVSIETAGRLACRMSAEAKRADSEPATRVIYVRGSAGMGVYFANKSKIPTTGEVVDNYDPDHETPTEDQPNGIQYRGVGRVIFTVEFYVSHVKQIIATVLLTRTAYWGRKTPSNPGWHHLNW